MLCPDSRSAFTTLRTNLRLDSRLPISDFIGKHPEISIADIGSADVSRACNVRLHSTWSIAFSCRCVRAIALSPISRTAEQPRRLPFQFIRELRGCPTTFRPIFHVHTHPTSGRLRSKKNRPGPHFARSRGNRGPGLFGLRSESATRRFVGFTGNYRLKSPRLCFGIQASSVALGFSHPVIFGQRNAWRSVNFSELSLQ